MTTRKLKDAVTSTAESALAKLPRPSGPDLPAVAGATLTAVANFLTLNQVAVDPKTVGTLSRILARFDPLEVRAALSASLRQSRELQADRILSILADRCWEACGLPPTVDVFLENVWDRVWTLGRPWTPDEEIVIRRYGWSNVVGQESDRATTITAQLRDLYQAHRARVVDRWIAELCLAEERWSKSARPAMPSSLGRPV